MGLGAQDAIRLMFGLYGLVGLGAAIFYSRLPKLADVDAPLRHPLGPSLRPVVMLAEELARRGHKGVRAPAGNLP